MSRDEQRVTDVGFQYRQNRVAPPRLDRFDTAASTTSFPITFSFILAVLCGRIVQFRQDFLLFVLSLGVFAFSA